MAKVKDWVDKWKRDVGVIRSINDQPVILQNETGEELFFGHFLEVPTKFYEYNVEKHSFNSPTFSWEERMKGSITAYTSRDYAHILKIKEAEGDIETENKSEEWSQTEDFEDLAAMARKVAFQDIVMPGEVSIHQTAPTTQAKRLITDSDSLSQYVRKKLEEKSDDWFDDEDTSDSDEELYEDHNNDEKRNPFSFYASMLIVSIFILFVGPWLFHAIDSQTVVEEYRVEDSVIIQEVSESSWSDGCYGVAEYDGQEIEFSSDAEHYEYLKENIGKEVKGEIETEKNKGGDVNYKAVWFWYELE